MIYSELLHDKTLYRRSMVDLKSIWMDFMSRSVVRKTDLDRRRSSITLMEYLLVGRKTNGYGVMLSGLSSKTLVFRSRSSTFPCLLRSSSLTSKSLGSSIHGVFASPRALSWSYKNHVVSGLSHHANLSNLRSPPDTGSFSAAKALEKAVHRMCFRCL